MANIDAYLSRIATGVYGEDVRGAIHDAIEAVNDDLPNTTNITQEVITARTPSHQTLEHYNSLGDRLDGDYSDMKDYVDTKTAPGDNAKVQINNATVGYSNLKDRLDSDYQNLNSKYQRIKELELICEDDRKTGEVIMRLGGSN